MAGKQIGYLRVSTLGQKTDRQLAGVKLDKVFEDRATGSNVNARQALERCLEYVREHDTLHVHSIDRLARNMSDLLAIVNELVSKDVAVRFHSENLVFSPSLNDPMAELTLHMLGAFAQFERTLISQRRKEGMEAARKRGKQIGRRSALSDEQVKQVIQKLDAGVTKKALAEEYGVSRTTLYAAIAAHKEAV